MAADADAVLLVAHGTVDDLGELPGFVSAIRHGRPAPPGFLAELRRRYERIGGSPLNARTRAQADALSAALGLPVLVGMRLWTPSVEAALADAAARGVARLVVLALAPFSAHVYAAAAEASLVKTTLGERAPRLVHVPAWGTEPGFVEAHARAIERVLSSVAEGCALVLTAHSLPSGVVQGGDPYEALVRECASAIGRRLGRSFELAFQSQGVDGGPWLGPDLPTTFTALRDRGAPGVVVAPIGFLAEHVETLYDLDVEARALAGSLGLAFTRVPALDADPTLIDALAALVRRALDGAAR